MENVKNATGVVEYEETQFLRIDGKNVFVEVLHSAFTIGKVQMNFCEYDPAKGNKMVKNIPIYMDLDDFLVFKNDVLSGKYAILAKNEKARIAKDGGYAKAIFEDMGGISAKRLKVQSKKYSFEIPDGMALSRIMYLTPGMKQDFMLSGQIGLGKESATGLIVPQGMPKEIVRIPMSGDTLKKLVLKTEAKILAYFAAEEVMRQMKKEFKSDSDEIKAILKRILATKK